MLCRVSTGIKSTFYRCIRQNFCIRDQLVHCIYTGIQVILDLIEVAIVRIGNLRRNIALRYAVHILSCHIQRTNNRVKSCIYPFNNLAEITLML